MNAWHFSFAHSPETVHQALCMLRDGVHPQIVAHDLGVDAGDLLDWIVDYEGMDLDTIRKVRALETSVENQLEEIFQLRRPFLGGMAVADIDPTRGFRRSEYRKKQPRARKRPT